MIKHYRETQYFRPWFYVVLGGLSVACGSFSLAQFLLAAPSFVGTALGVLAVLALVTLVGLGRMVVSVDGDTLRIAFGWLGVVRKSFDLASIAQARVCLFSSVPAYVGWRSGLDGAACYAARSRRGVEIVVDGRRMTISSADPLALKESVLRSSEPIDDRPEYLREKLPFSRGRAVAGYGHWGLLDPDKIRAISA